MIFAAAFILHALIFGVESTRAVLPDRVARTMLAGGVLLYAGVESLGLLKGGNYLDYSVLSRDPVHGQHLGILLIELGVGSPFARP